jgi:hypothetical protein
VDERTRDEQALVYGEFDFWPMRGLVRPSALDVWKVASLWHWRAAPRLVALRWRPKRTTEAPLTTSGTSWAIGRSTVAAARVWCSPCRVTKGSSRLGLADAGAPWADPNERRSR